MIRFLYQCLVLVLLTFTLSCQAVFAFSPVQRIISSTDGLDSVVNDIAFDDHGFAWFATEQGLYRATNTNLTKVDLSKSEYQLQDQFFYQLQNLGSNKLLIDVFQEIYFFDSATNQFAALSTLKAFTTLDNGRYAKLLSLSNNNRFLLTSSGQLLNFSDLNEPAMTDVQLPILSQDTYRDVVEISSNRLLVATEKKLGLINETGNVRWLSLPKSVGKINQLKVINHRVFLAANGGFYELNEEGKPHQYRVNQLSQLAVFSMDVDTKQKLWLVTQKNVITFDLKTDGLAIVGDLNFSLGERITVDSNNLIWLTGQQNQVAVITDEVGFLTDVFSAQTPYFLEEQHTWSLWGEQYTLYAGTSNQLTVINRNDKSSVLVPINGLDESGLIYGIKALDNHNLLLSTTNGLFVFNKETQYSQSFSQWSGGQTSLAGKTVYQSVYQPHSQQWWFATSDGIYRWRTGTSDIVFVDFGADKTQTFRSAFVDNNGTLWVGGESTFGFYSNGQFTAIDKSLFGKDVLPIISHIAQVDDVRLWFGSTFHGVFEYYLPSKKLSPVKPLAVQECQSIYFFQKIANKQFTGCGSGELIEYELSTHLVKVFDDKDGLISSEFNEGALFFQPQVGLFVGTPTGIMLLDTNKLSKRITNDGIYVSDISAYYPEHSEIKLLPKSGMSFSPGAGLISLQISSHNFLTRKFSNVRYRLLGNNIPKQKNFIRVSSNGMINLSNVDSGRYTLQLLNQETNQTHEKPYSFHFIVSQVWWKSEQFKSFLAFFIFIIGTLTVLRHQSRTERFKRLNTELLETQDRLQQALKSSDSDLWEWHTAKAKLHIGNYSKIFSQDSNKQIYDMAQLKIHPDDQEYILTQWNEMVAGKRDAFDAEYRQMGFAGDWRWIRTKGRPIKYNLEDGSVETVSGIYTDVTTTRVLEEQASLLAEAFENTSEGVIIFDENEVAIVVNKAAEKLIGMSLTNNVKHSFSDVISGVDVSINELLENENHWSGELELDTSKGQCRPVWLTLSQIKSRTSDVQKYVVVFSDISQRKSAEEKLRRLANFDPLTGLANRTLFSEKLLDSIQQGQRENSRIALMFMDLDRFKNINDSYGHNMGDALLIEAASRIQESISKSAVLSRFGGDEFVLLVPDIENTAEVDKIAKLIHRSIEAPFRIFEREFYISTSIGVSLWPDHALQPDALIKNADLAMYHAKEDGPGNVRYFSNARNEKNLYFLRIESELRKAIQRDQFELHYQPQINILDGDKLVGMEALLRWNHPEDGFISPDIFIEVAESAGLIIEIDRWVFKTACKQVSQWKKQFDSDFKVSINVSAAHFLQPDYVDTLTEVLIQTGVEGKFIGLEITEGVLMKEVDQAQSHLAQLQLLGINIAIDDFGTGYSSLAYLRHFSVNTLKIDRKFIIDIKQNRADQAIVTSIIELARNLRLKVVAEGIETYDQMEHLIGRGCYLMQGFYFSKPLPLAEMDRYLENSFHSEQEEALT